MFCQTDAVLDETAILKFDQLATKMTETDAKLDETG